MLDLAKFEKAHGTWNLDASHSEIGFTVRHAGISKVRGKFESFTGTVVADEAKNQLSISASVETSSFNSGNEGRDEHIKSADFFESEKFPTMEFTSNHLEEIGSNLVLAGDLTLRGVTKQVTFDVEFNGFATDPFGNLRAGFEAETTISRKEFGMVWNAALETGGVLVSDKVKINLDLSFINNAEASV